MTIKEQFAHPEGFVGRIVGALMGYQNRDCIAWAVGLLDIQPDKTVLEIGFGTGVGLHHAAKTAAHVAGVDASREMTEQARWLNHNDIDAGRVTLQQGYVESLPFKSASFDKAFTINTLNLWFDLHKGLGESHRVLKPGGTFAVFEQPPSGIDSRREIRRRGRAICRMMSGCGFRKVRPLYARLDRGMVVGVMGIAV